MSTLVRYLTSPIIADLKEKMVFLGGPRQVGKTTFSKELLKGRGIGRNLGDGKISAFAGLSHSGEGADKPSVDSAAYLNWDFLADRKLILNGGWPANARLVVLDEIHKYAKWRNLIKGYYDKLKESHSFLVTGSARLDYYRKSGDSLLGRYHYFRMHPFSLPEISGVDYKALLKFGGFPESFIKQRESFLRRWHLERRERVIYSDVRDLERVSEISSLAMLAESIPERVGSPLSRKNLAQDLEIDFKTLERWVSILENVYYCFRILPFGPPKIRAVKKEQKIYLWDWSEHIDEGKRWENFVASHLLKYCHFLQDTEGHVMELRFLRDVTKREIDFVVMQDKKPLFAVDCKTGERATSPHLRYFAERTNIPHFYQVHTGKKYYRVSDKITVLPFEELCREVSLV